MNQLRISGVVFVVLLLASTAMFGELMGAFGDPDHVFEEYYSHEANRRRDVAGAYLLVACSVAFLVFSNSLAAQLGRAQSLAPMVSGSAIVFSALLAVAACLLGAVSLSITFGESFDDQRPFNSAYAMVPQAGSMLVIVAAPLVAAFHIAVVGLAGKQRLSPPVRTVSFVCSFLLLFSVLYLPQLALPAWVLVASFALRSESNQTGD
jgi:hypothetical protein